MNQSVQIPISKETAKKLKAGDYVYLTGVIYTARDAAHKRMQETLDAGKELPMEIKGNAIYYMGPSPARPGCVIGSAGPTTASRMDKYTPRLLDLGLGAMIGKGKRSQAVIEAIKRNDAAEAIRKLEVKDFPVVVVIDSDGNNLYETAAGAYEKKKDEG